MYADESRRMPTESVDPRQRGTFGAAKAPPGFFVIHTHRLLENIMKSRTKNEAENDLHKVKDKTGKPLPKRMKDPTLEGIDEHKVGRIPEKLASVD